MKVLIATPAFGGQLTTNYFLSALATRDLLHQHRVQHAFYTLSNESLIPRARNKCAKFALEHHFTHLLFIDADIEWKPEWVLQLLASEHPIIGGMYPIKMLPIKWNYNALEESDEDIIEVKHLATGFLKIDVSVFQKLTTHTPQYKSYEPAAGETKIYYDLFPSGEFNGEYESEDWGFCRLARQAGFPVMLDKRIKCKHVGSFVYEEQD